MDRYRDLTVSLDAESNMIRGALFGVNCVMLITVVCAWQMPMKVLASENVEEPSEVSEVATELDEPSTNHA
jgi:hypothetical protein